MSAIGAALVPMAFAYSGWNSTVVVAEEVENPGPRDSAVAFLGNARHHGDLRFDERGLLVSDPAAEPRWRSASRARGCGTAVRAVDPEINHGPRRDVSARMFERIALDQPAHDVRAQPRRILF